jgi:uncharacterized protein (TIGR03435 family)
MPTFATHRGGEAQRSRIWFLGASVPLCVVILAGAWRTPAYAQSPAFETASVKANKGGGPPGMEIRVTPNGGFIATNAPLRTLVRESFRVQDYQLIGLPDWAATERFDITARAAEAALGAEALAKAATPEWQPRVQALLRDRFRMSARFETREMPMYSAVVVRADGRLGPRLTATPASTTEYCVGQRRPGDDRPPADPARAACGIRQSIGTMQGRDMPLAALWRFVSQQAGRAVVDRSGLTGNYDFDLTWTPEQFANRETPAVVNGNSIDPNGPSLFTALQEQLGLKLDAQRGPVDVLVVERIERPTEN